MSTLKRISLEYMGRKIKFWMASLFFVCTCFCPGLCLFSTDPPLPPDLALPL